MFRRAKQPIIAAPEDTLASCCFSMVQENPLRLNDAVEICSRAVRRLMPCNSKDLTPDV